MFCLIFPRRHSLSLVLYIPVSLQVVRYIVVARVTLLLPNSALSVYTPHPRPPDLSRGVLLLPKRVVPYEAVPFYFILFAFGGQNGFHFISDILYWLVLHTGTIYVIMFPNTQGPAVVSR